jgi:predicted DNA-binding protein
MSKPVQFTERLNLRISPPTDRRLTSISKRLNMTKADVARNLLQFSLMLHLDFLVDDMETYGLRAKQLVDFIKSNEYP